jgi:inorganic pyrophosphatase
MDFSKLTPGSKAPEEVLALIEIPANTDIKYEFDEETGVLMVDRFAYTTMHYPAAYGLIPGTHGKDGDALDVLVLCSKELAPGVGIKVRPIGLLEMEDEEGIDTKILCVPAAKIDPFYAHVQDIGDIDEMTKKKIQQFFNRYKDLEPNKWVKTGDFKGKEAAYEEIRNGMKS